MEEHIKATKQTYPDYSMEIIKQYEDGDYVISVELVNEDGVGEGIWSTLDVVHIVGSSSNAILDQVIADECEVELDDNILEELCASIITND